MTWIVRLKALNFDTPQKSVKSGLDCQIIGWFIFVDLRLIGSDWGWVYESTRNKSELEKQFLIDRQNRKPNLYCLSFKDTRKEKSRVFYDAHVLLSNLKEYD